MNHSDFEQTMIDTGLSIHEGIDQLEITYKKHSRTIDADIILKLRDAKASVYRATEDAIKGFNAAT